MLLLKKNNSIENWNKYNLLGKVKEQIITFNKYEKKFGEKVTTKNVQFTIQYDQNGNRTEIIQYNKYGRINTKKYFKYDNKGNIIEYDYFYPTSWEPVHEVYGFDQKKYIYEYENNNLISFSIFKESGHFLLSKTIYKYDDNGNMIEKAIYESDGTLIHNYKYNENRSNSYKSNFGFDSISNIIKYSNDYYNDNYSTKYNDFGNIISIELKGNSNSVYYTSDYFIESGIVEICKDANDVSDLEILNGIITFEYSYYE